jgi:flagellar basal-body rod modification protein FlgD
MTTSAATSSTASTATSTAAYSTSQSTAALNQNYQTFLTLLTTQLKNQDPLNPEDSSQFTNQLVLFSQVEQQIDTNTSLNSILTNQTTGMTQQALSYLGMNVAADNSALQYDGSNDVTVGYTMPSGAASATVGIFNSSGVEVYSTDASTDAGTNSFTWNGTDSSGDTQAAGTYTVQVNASDSSGNPLTVPTITPGTVTAVSVANGTTYLTINGQQVPVSDVVSAAYPASSSSSSSSSTASGS